MTRSVLFVCTGNTCRSPMAERLFSRLCREAGLSVAVRSAGTQARPGMPLSAGAEAVFAKRGFGPAQHRARGVDAAELAGADAVYVMERMHRDLLASRFPESAAKLAVLREAAGLLPADVKDPVGTGALEHEDCAASIEEALQIIVLREREKNANPR